MTGGDEADNSYENDQCGESDDDAAEDATAFSLECGLLGAKGLVGDDVRIG